jgi:predicted DCC family thiol-disulfide oxidoreductase YuxK
MRLFHTTDERKPAYLLYDTNCGSCKRFMKIVRLLDFSRKLIPVALQDQLSLELVSGKLTSEEMFCSFHLVQVMNSGQNQVLSAGDALVQLLEYFPFGGRITSMMQRVKISRSLVSWTYLQASRIRTASCKLVQV